MKSRVAGNHWYKLENRHYEFFDASSLVGNPAHYKIVV